MTRGEQFLVLRKIDHETLIRQINEDITRIRALQIRYVYSPNEIREQNRRITQLLADRAYHQEKLTELGGAENEETLTEYKYSESPMPGFTGITCSTVV